MNYIIYSDITTNQPKSWNNYQDHLKYGFMLTVINVETLPRNMIYIKIIANYYMKNYFSKIQNFYMKHL